MNKDNYSFWNTFEVWCVCRYLKYEDYIRIHGELNLVHSLLSESSYSLINTIFNNELQLNGELNEQIGENPFSK